MKLRHVVIHSPGEAWQQGVDFREQPGVMEHVQHYAKLHADGKLLMGGPFVESDSGGMMVATEDVTKDELVAFANQDPAIQSGLLIFQVKTWYTPMEKETG